MRPGAFLKVSCLVQARPPIPILLAGREPRLPAVANPDIDLLEHAPIVSAPKPLPS